MRKPIGIILIVLGVCVVLFVLYENSKISHQRRIFSPYSLLLSSWDNYKQQFISKSGRTVDPSQNDTTTSEAQGYALLRAVWVDDKPTFDRVYVFTKDNMKQPDSNLFGWQYGKVANNKYGFTSNGGNNPASDADSDIAYALILASRRWNNPSYQKQALPIIRDMWQYETATTSAGKRYVIAGPWAQDPQKLIINVSYFAPYEWRTFATVDKKDDWDSLIDPAYQLLNVVGTSPLDKARGVGLPPNWVAVDKQTGQVMPSNISGYTTDYSFDAMRTPWRIALDYQLYKDKRAYNYLKNSYAFLTNDYEKNHTLVLSYGHDGSRQTNLENPAMYATALGYFDTVDKGLAAQMYQDKVIQLYSNDEDSFDKNLPYYEQNWLWFGTALYNNFLSNFSS